MSPALADCLPLNHQGSPERPVRRPLKQSNERWTGWPKVSNVDEVHGKHEENMEQVKSAELGDQLAVAD